MKKCCKNVDITNRELIRKATYKCLDGKMNRRDTVQMFSEYSKIPVEKIWSIVDEKEYGLLDGIIETVVDGVQNEITTKNYVVRKIRYTLKRDSCNGKIRKIGIQDIKQQIYDYIAVAGLEELFKKKLGYYQCGAVEGKGNEFGTNAIYKWLKDRNNRWAWQGDVRHYYENIDRSILKNMFKKDVSNDRLLELTFFLIDTFDTGLSIGSYLSQFLANYFLSKAYIYMSQVEKHRRKRNGEIKRVRLISHVLFQMDDILFISHSRKNLEKAVRSFKLYLRTKLRLELKETARYIDLNNDYIDIQGKKISRRSLTIRSSTFLKVRRTYKDAYSYICSGMEIPYKLAKSCASRYGSIKHSNSKRFERRYHIERIQEKAAKTIGRYAKREKQPSGIIYFAQA